MWQARLYSGACSGLHVGALWCFLVENPSKRECPAEEFRIVLVQPSHHCVICLATAHSLAPGSVQVDCLDEEQFDEEQQDGENPVEGSQTVRAQPLDRCGICLATGRSLVPGSVRVECLGEEHLDERQ